jgi:haloacetate dehalogenase
VAPRLDQQARLTVGATSYLVATGGDGTPLLLLHGFPETHVCWRHIAPALATSHSIVAPDLKGYGASEAPAGGPQGEGYSKREMAGELVELMGALGHERFAVVGHDRGARVAYRLALDHPEGVTRVALLNVVPTVDQFERMGAGPSLGYWPWFLLAQPAPFPEEMFGAAPAALLDHVFATWSSDPEAIAAVDRAAYRASFYLDREHESDDRAAGRRVAAPALVVTGEDETQLADAPDVWRAWADDLSATRVPGGHFIPEESPEQLGDVLATFLAA